MKKILLTAIISFTLSSCSFLPDHPAFRDDGYAKWMRATVEKVEKKPDYRRIPIDTSEQIDHYFSLTYKAYKEEISSQEFIKAMERKYPWHSASIRWIADQLPNHKTQSNAKPLVR